MAHNPSPSVLAEGAYMFLKIVLIEVQRRPESWLKTADNQRQFRLVEMHKRLEVMTVNSQYILAFFQR